MQQTYKEAFLTGLRDVLKSAGFRKRGAVFHRASGDAVHLIGLQSSIDSAGQIPRVTINLAIWCKPFAERGTEPSVIASQWRCRLGDLMPARSDVWWTLSGKDSVAPAVREVAVALKAYGIPALDKLPDCTSLLALWESGRSPGITLEQSQRYSALAQAGRPTLRDELP
jgi:hypothetical protein